jgi:hypothetical protein
MSKHINSTEPRIYCDFNKIRKLNCIIIEKLVCYDNRIKMLINIEATDIDGLDCNKIKDYSRYIDNYVHTGNKYQAYLFEK